LIQSLFALGHGGVTGAGLGRSIQELHYLPFGHTDFIFAIIGVEMGLIGGLCFFLVFFLFILYGFITALQCSDLFGLLLGIGIVTMILVQFIFNIGAVTGSSLILSLASTGILLAISRENNRKRMNKNK